MDQNTVNFMKGATISKRELTYALDAWIQKCKDGKFEISLCDEGKKALLYTLEKLSTMVAGANLPTITEPLTTYVIDLFADTLQLGIYTYPEGTEFDEDGMERPVEVTEDADIKETGKDPYKLIFCVNIPTIPLSVWAKQNKIMLVTAKSWVQKGRMQTFSDGGHNLRVSAIQYVPYALYENKQSGLRFRGPVRFPEKVTAKHPSLAGEVLEVVVAKSNTVPDSFHILIVSKLDTKETPSVQQFTLRESQRNSLVNALLSADGMRSVMEQHYHSPIGEIEPGSAYRFAHIKPHKEDPKALFEMEIIGTTENRNITRTPFPAFTLSVGASEQLVCELSGLLMTTHHLKEVNLLYALFGEFDAIEMRNRVLTVTGGHKKGDYPWNKQILFIHQMTAGQDTEKIGMFLRSLKVLSSRAFAFDASLIIAALPLDSDGLDENAGYLVEAGFQEVQDTDDPYKDVRLFYAYVD